MNKFDGDSQRENPEAEELAGRLQAKLNGKGGESTFKDVWHLLAEKPASTIKAAESLMPNAGNNAKDAEASLNSKLEHSLAPAHAARIERMVAEKSMIDIPPLERRNAVDLIKEGNLQIGKLQEIKLDDGRSFDLYVPPVLRTFKDDGETKVPVVVGIHGVMRAAVAAERSMNESAGLDLLAEREGFVAIYPHASKLVSFPAATLGWSIPDRENLLPTNPKINDVNAIDKMISYVRDFVAPIANKVGLIGHSDGGRMAQGFAIKHPEEVAYLVPWSSTWMKNDSAPSQGIPTRIILNDKDETLPIAGGEGRNSKLGDIFLRTNVPDSRPKMMADIWSRANNCGGESISNDSSGKVNSRTFQHCQFPLREDTIHGSSHSIADWHNIGGGTMFSPADVTLNTAYDVVKQMMPYLLRH